MEDFTQRLKSRGATLDTDASSVTRLSQRPGSSQTRGAAFQDFGSDFGLSSRPAHSRSTPTHRTQTHKSGKGIAISFDDDFSDDEIDFLSGSSRHGSESPEKPRRPSKRPTINAAPLPVVIDHHQADPNYKAIDFKKVKIPKKSAAASSTAQTPENSQESRATESGAGPSSSRPQSSSRALGLVSDKGLRRKKTPLRERSPNQDRSRTRRSSTPVSDADQRDKRSLKDMDETPRPSRVVPRPVKKGGRSSLGKSQTVPDLGALSSQDKGQPLSRSQTVQDFIHISSEESDVPRMDASRSGQGKGSRAKGSDPFASLSPLSKHKGSKGKEKERVDPISGLSPLTSPAGKTRKDPLTSFPMPSPLSSPCSKRSSRSPDVQRKQAPSQRKSAVLSSSEDDEPPRRTLRPFPMETQVLASICGSSSVGERPILGGDGEDFTGTYRKKPPRESEHLSLGGDSDSDEDSAYMRSLHQSCVRLTLCDHSVPRPFCRSKDAVSVVRRTTTRRANTTSTCTHLCRQTGIASRGPLDEPHWFESTACCIRWCMSAPSVRA